MDEVRLNAEAAAAANEIRATAHELDRLERKVQDYLVWGLRGGWNTDQRTRGNQQRDQLLHRRSALALTLRKLTEQH